MLNLKCYNNKWKIIFVIPIFMNNSYILWILKNPYLCVRVHFTNYYVTWRVVGGSVVIMRKACKLIKYVSCLVLEAQKIVTATMFKERKAMDMKLIAWATTTSIHGIANGEKRLKFHFIFLFFCMNSVCSPQPWRPSSELLELMFILM